MTIAAGRPVLREWPAQHDRRTTCIHLPRGDPGGARNPADRSSRSPPWRHGPPAVRHHPAGEQCVPVGQLLGDLRRRSRDSIVWTRTTTRCCPSSTGFRRASAPIRTSCGTWTTTRRWTTGSIWCSNASSMADGAWSPVRPRTSRTAPAATGASGPTRTIRACSARSSATPTPVRMRGDGSSSNAAT